MNQAWKISTSPGLGDRSFFARMGDVMQAGLVFLGERLVFAVPTFAAVTIALVGGWLGVVTLLNRQLRAKADQTGTRQL